MEYFDVYGNTWPELSESVRKLGPVRDHDWDDETITHVWGATYYGYRVSWSWWPRDGWCEIGRVKVRWRPTVVLPQWDPPPDASPELRTRWRNVVKSIYAHEMEHVRILNAAGREMRRRVSRIGHVPRCEALERVVLRIRDEVIEEYDVMHEIFDDEHTDLFHAFDREEMDEAYERGD